MSLSVIRRNNNFLHLKLAGRIQTVAQLVEALRYKPEGRGFDNRWCHWNFATQRATLEGGTNRLS